MSYNPNNIFAKILRNEISYEKVDEDEYVIAFKDIHPKATVHVLVIPKGEYTCFDDFSAKAPPEMIAGFFTSVGRITRDLGVDESGYRLIMNKGVNGGQEVDHFHIHILGGKKLGPMVCS